MKDQARKITNVDGKPQIFVHEELSDDVERKNRGSLLKKEKVITLSSYLNRPGILLTHPLMSAKRHEQLKNDVEPDLLEGESIDFSKGIGGVSSAEYIENEIRPQRKNQFIGLFLCLKFLNKTLGLICYLSPYPVVLISACSDSLTPSFLVPYARILTE